MPCKDQFRTIDNDKWCHASQCALPCTHRRKRIPPSTGDLWMLGTCDRVSILAHSLESPVRLLLSKNACPFTTIALFFSMFLGNHGHLHRSEAPANCTFYILARRSHSFWNAAQARNLLYLHPLGWTPNDSRTGLVSSYGNQRDSNRSATCNSLNEPKLPCMSSLPSCILDRRHCSDRRIGK